MTATEGRVFVEVGDARATDPDPTGVWDLSRWDTPGAEWGGTMPSFTPIHCRVRHVSIAGGRAGALDVFGPITAEISAANDDGFATWSTTAPSPLIVGAWLRVRADDEPLFMGRIRRIVDRYSPGERPGVDIVATDSLAQLGTIAIADSEAPWGAGQTAAERIGALLDQVRWPPDLRDLDPFGPPLTAHRKGGRLLDIVQRVAVTCGGAVFADRQGRICYRDAEWLRVDPRASTPQAVIANDGRPGAICATAMAPNGPDTERVINDVQLKGQDEGPDPAVTVDFARLDFDSSVRWGLQSWQTGPLYTTDVDHLAILAGRTLGLRKAPVPRLDSISISPIADPGTPPGPQNLLSVNQATMEADPSGWTATVGAVAPSGTRAREGARSLQATGGAGTADNLWPDDPTSSMENGTVGLWALRGAGFSALAPTQDQATDGTWALRATVAGPDAVLQAQPAVAAMAPVAPSQTYTVMASVRWPRALVAPGTAAEVGYALWTAAGGFLVGPNYGPLTSVAANTWTVVRCVVTLPATATIARMSAYLRIVGGQTGDVGYWDRFGIFPGDVPAAAWALPSVPPSAAGYRARTAGARFALPAPGERVTFAGSVWPQADQALVARFGWYDATGAAALNPPDVPITAPAGEWTDWVVHATVPPGMASVLPELRCATPSAVAWHDRLGYFATDETAWTAPGAAPGEPGALPFVAAARFGDRVETHYLDPLGWRWSFASHVHAIGHDITPSGNDQRAAEWTTQLILDDASFWSVEDPWDTARWDRSQWAEAQ